MAISTRLTNIMSGVHRSLMKRAIMGVRSLKGTSKLKFSIKTPTITIIREMRTTKKMELRPIRSNRS